MKKIYCLPAGEHHTRESATAHRLQLKPHLDTGRGVIYFNLEEVQGISESFADELFGVLVAQYGLEHFLNHIQVINANSAVLQSIGVIIEKHISRQC